MTDYRTRDDYPAFLRRCAAAPADDTPRLVLADWLDDHGAAGRAEFIRVQCRLAELEREKTDRLNDEVDWEQCTSVCASWCPNCGDCKCPEPEDSRNDAGCPLHATDSPHCCLDSLERKLNGVRKRERELLHDDRLDLWDQFAPWAKDRGWTMTTFAHEPAFRVGPSEGHADDMKCTLSRGFISTVRGPLAALLEHLSRMGAELGLVERAEPTEDDAIIRLSPSRFSIRQWVRARLNPHEMDEQNDGHGIIYPTEAAARDAVSDTILALCRERAGLVQSTST